MEGLMQPEYLGDGVYVSSSPDFPLIITTGHHLPECADNKIFFEPEILRRLKQVLQAAEPPADQI